MHSVGDVITFRNFDDDDPMFQVAEILPNEISYYIIPLGSVNHPLKRGGTPLSFSVSHKTLPTCIKRAKTTQKVYEDYKDLFI